LLPDGKNFSQAAVDFAKLWLCRQRKFSLAASSAAGLASTSSHNDLKVTILGPDLQNILLQSYDYLTIMPKLQSTYDGRLIYKTSYNE